MSFLIPGPREGFREGKNAIAVAGEWEHDTGMDFEIYVLPGGEAEFAGAPGVETAFLLMHGAAEAHFGDKAFRFMRADLFDGAPVTLRVPAGVDVVIDTKGETSEWAVIRTANDAAFEPVVYWAEDVRNEQRGQGLLNDASHRIVRTIFDKTNAPESALVLGEVITFPGRWSSYPPHHHPQPEIYHYRFNPTQGYGHAELGEDVYKVRHCDTVKIFDGLDHPQTAAPGYAMYYLWAIRHLPGDPYIAPEFTPLHKGVFDKDFKMWEPKG